MLIPSLTAGGIGFEIKTIDGLTLPLTKDWSLNVHYMPKKRTKIRYEPKDHTYKTNQDPNIKSLEWKMFTADMDALQDNVNDEATFTIHGPDDGPDPVCCLFSKPKFGGNVWCMGVGGGDVLPQWKNKAQSVSCHAGANAWLYGEKYGDAGGVLIPHNVEDLDQQPFGKDKKTMKNRVKAIWVFKPKGS